MTPPASSIVLADSVRRCPEPRAPGALCPKHCWFRAPVLTARNQQCFGQRAPGALGSGHLRTESASTILEAGGVTRFLGEIGRFDAATRPGGLGSLPARGRSAGEGGPHTRPGRTSAHWPVSSSGRKCPTGYRDLSQKHSGNKATVTPEGVPGEVVRPRCSLAPSGGLASWAGQGSRNLDGDDMKKVEAIIKPV